MKPKKPKSGESLAELNPELAKQWHPNKNGNLTPYNVTSGSHKRVWWKCSKGDDHEWEASIKTRMKGNGCPICSGYKVVKSNCLATINPELAKEWHPTKNGDLTPYEVVPGSQKKVWWKCPKGDDHEWKAIIASRNNGSGCAICNNLVVVKSNCLATLNTELAKEWHPTKNGKLSPFNVHPGSHKKVWWKCPKGDDHEWRASISSRNKGVGCPVCANKIIVPSNSLATLNPDLAKEWHPTRNGKLTPFQISPNSGKSVWWKCPKGDDHEWKASVYSRNNGNGCAVCANLVIVKSNCLATLKPELAKEWHPTKNGAITPNDVGPGSTNKVWWQCGKNEKHVWEAQIRSRNQGTGCPICFNASSIPELRIFTELKTIFKSAEHRTVLGGFEVDIYIPEIKFGIEYDGMYWHYDRIEKDIEKNKALESIMQLCRVREKGLPLISNIDIEVEHNKLSVETIKLILDRIQNNCKIESDQISNNIKRYFQNNEWIATNDFDKMQSNKNTVPYKESISFLYPDLVKEWHPFKNKTYLPSKFSAGSHKKVWWKGKCGHEWIAAIYSRTSGVKCPICSNRKVDETNCLATLYPKLSKEWHPIKNGELTPYNVTPGSHKKVWWRNDFGREWEAEIRVRVNKIRNQVDTDQLNLFENQKDSLN